MRPRKTERKAGQYASRVVTIGLVAGLVLLGLLPFAARPSGRSERLPEPDVRLRAVTAHWEGVRREFDRAFRLWSKAHLGRVVGIEWLDVGGTADMVKFVQSEFARSPSGIGVDLMFGGGVEVYQRLAVRGFFVSTMLPKRELSRIPAELFGSPLRDPAGRWYGAALAGFGILCNQAVVGRLHLPAVRTWEDLARPEFAGWVGSGNPQTSGSTHMVYEIVLQSRGWEKGYSVLTRIAANTRSFYMSSAEVPRDVMLGEVACGMAIDSYAWAALDRVRRVAGGLGRLSYVFPKGRTVINPDGIAVLKGAPHLREAQAFLAFVLSSEGQRLWMLPKGAPGGPARFLLGRMSIRPGLYAALGSRRVVRENPFHWRNGMRYDSAKAAARWDVLNTLVGACLIENNEWLKKAWRALLAHGRDRAALSELTHPPVSEEDVERLQGRWERDPALRSRLRAAWARACRTRYQRVAARYGRSVGCSP